MGGFYLNAEELIEIYLEMADPGSSSKLRFHLDKPAPTSVHLITSKTSEQIMRLMSQRNSMGELELFKTGTSHNQQDAWVLNVLKDHIILVWLGTPDNEPTSVLTGRGAAFPISRDIKLALGLQSPKIRDDYKIAQNHIKTLKKCEKLIQYPQNGEWVRSDKLTLSLAGDNSAQWYLNGVKLASYRPNISLIHPGVNKITAVSGECRETSEIFFEKLN